MKFRPCATFRPSELTSLMNIRRPASRWPPLTMPNSAACLIEFVVSPPALARPTIFAFEACACSRNDEKSDEFNGCLTLPRILPPAFVTAAVVSRSSAAPNA